MRCVARIQPDRRLAHPLMSDVARSAVISSRFSASFLGEFETRRVATPWGDAPVDLASVDGETVACLWRYGRDLTLPSHKINYRANLWALRTLGVDLIVSQNAIGSCNAALAPGTVVISDDFIDCTHGRPRSFFDDADAWVRVDMSAPFCPPMRAALVEAVVSGPDPVVDHGIFLCGEGPRFESAAEIRMFRGFGADIIGTPLVPEIVLAREAEMCFASIAAIINYATGLAPEVRHVGAGSMVDFYYGSGFHDRIEAAMRIALIALRGERDCTCRDAMRHGFHGTPPSWYQPRR